MEGVIRYEEGKDENETTELHMSKRDDWDDWGIMDREGRESIGSFI